jgi:hypothetical protein
MKRRAEDPLWHLTHANPFPPGRSRDGAEREAAAALRERILAEQLTLPAAPPLPARRRPVLRRAAIAGGLACAAGSALAVGLPAGRESVAPGIPGVIERAHAAIASDGSVLHLRAVVTTDERDAWEDKELYDSSDYELWRSPDSSYQRGIERNRRGDTLREVVQRPDAVRREFAGGGGLDPFIEIHPPVDAAAPPAFKRYRSSASPWLDEFVGAVEQRLDESAKVSGKTEIDGRPAYRLQIDQPGVSDALAADPPLRNVRRVPSGPSAWDSMTLWVSADTHLPIVAHGHSDLPGKGPRDFRVRFLAAERVQFSKSLFELAPHPGVPVCWYRGEFQRWPGGDPPSGTDGPCSRLTPSAP